MRELVFMKRALNAIYKVAQYRATEYYPETGEKFINEVFDFCEQYSKVRVVHPLCKNSILSKHYYSCIVFKRKWVIAFKYSETEFKVYRFIWGAKLK